MEHAQEVIVNRVRYSRIATKAVFREYAESLIVAVMLAMILRAFVFSAYRIPTGSMAPTLRAGDFVFAYHLAYGFPLPFSGGLKAGQSLPRRGDVIIFRFPGNESVNYVKRVVGLPGDRITIRKRILFVNGVASSYSPVDHAEISDHPGNEYYSVQREQQGESGRLVMSNNEGEGAQFGPVVVQPGHVFVLGDNRDSSDDSRYWGAVPLKNIEGRVSLVWLSLDWLNRADDSHFPTVRWQRLFSFVN